MAPIHRHFTNSKTKTLSRDRSIIQHFIHTTGIRCFLSIHRLQCDCDSLRCCCSRPEHYPPLETSKRSHCSGWASHGRNRRTGPEKTFLDLDMCWLLKHNSGPNPHTEVQYMVYVSASFVPRVRLCHSCVLAEAAEDNFARHTARALPTARLWARRNTITLGTPIEAECPADKQPTGLYICQFDRTN